MLYSRYAVPKVDTNQQLFRIHGQISQFQNRRFINPQFSWQFFSRRPSWHKFSWSISKGCTLPFYGLPSSYLPVQEIPTRIIQAPLIPGAVWEGLTLGIQFILFIMWKSKHQTDSDAFLFTARIPCLQCQKHPRN